MVLCQKYRVGLRQAFEERGSTTSPLGIPMWSATHLTARAITHSTNTEYTDIGEWEKQLLNY